MKLVRLCIFLIRILILNDRQNSYGNKDRRIDKRKKGPLSITPFYLKCRHIKRRNPLIRLGYNKAKPLVLQV